MRNRKIEDIAIIELGNGHQECIYSQILFLKKAGYRVHLILPEKLFPYVNHDPVWDKLYLHNVSGSGSFRELWSIARYTKSNKISKLIFNTAENAVVRNFLFLERRAESIGVLHNILKLKSSGTQKCISRRIKKYFVLNDYLIQSDTIPQDLKVTSFYPIFFPGFQGEKPKDKKRGEIWVVIPGQLELKRRDYDGLIRSLRQGISPKIKFILLGNAKTGDGEKIIRSIEDNHLTGNFIFFQNYISENEFHSYIINSDMVMPLIHPVNEWQKNYRKKNISGTFNFAFAYKKPLLMHDYFSGIDDFDVSSLFYNETSLNSLLRSLVNKPGMLAEKAANLKRYRKFKFDYQCRKYLEFIESENGK